VTYTDGALDAILVVQQATSSVVSVVVVDSINIGINLDTGIDIQISFRVAKVPFAVDDVVGVDLGLGFDLGHELVGIVVASLQVEVVNVDVCGSVD
jgi:uncharacterized membrane protein YciS (DUF1049 family)